MGSPNQPGSTPKCPAPPLGEPTPPPRGADSPGVEPAPRRGGAGLPTSAPHLGSRLPTSAPQPLGEPTPPLGDSAPPPEGSRPEFLGERGGTVLVWQRSSEIRPKRTDARYTDFIVHTFSNKSAAGRERKECVGAARGARDRPRRRVLLAEGVLIANSTAHERGLPADDRCPQPRLVWF